MSVSIAKEIVPETEIFICYQDQLPTELSYLSEVFSGEKGEVFVQVTSEGKSLLVGVGKEEELSLDDIRNTMAKVAKKTRQLKIKAAVLRLPVKGLFLDKEVVRVITQGIGLGVYTFDKYKNNGKESVTTHFYIDFKIDTKKENDLETIITAAMYEVEGVCLARNLINEPANKLFPKKLAEIAQEIGRESGFEVEILDEKEMENIGMGALLAVGNGSVNPPRLIIMRYKAGKDDEILGLVGKGLTCDTGGYSLKGTDSMYYMKSDMSGAANVLGIMSIVAKNKIKKNIIAVIPSCENVISGNSYKIGDVLESMAGKTIEVLNTDAEGRLALADALHYIVTKEEVDKVIDIATLTGVAGTTFGNVYTATVANDDEFYNDFELAAQKAEEKFWRLPTDKAYREMINSDVADLKNTGGSGGGTITAGMFLQEFIQDKPWIHLDIAATACTNPGRSEYEYKGGTGIGIRTIYELIKG